MKTVTYAVLALGLVGGMAVNSPLPTKAQEIIFSGPGVGVEIVTRPYYYRHHRYNRYYGGEPYAYQYYRRPYGRWHTYNGCPPRYTVQDGVCKPYRGY